MNKTNKINRTTINIIASVMVLMIDILISLFMSPYIVKHIGVEANGFVSLAGNFVTYAALIVSALNSMATRFITFEYIRKDYKKSNLYYNSVFWGNLIIVAVLLLPALVVICKLEHVLNVPREIIGDVKLLFFFVFFNFLLPVGLPNWECGVYIKNRLDRTYFPSVLISILRCVILMSMLLLLKPHVWYIGFANTVSVICTLAVDRYNTHHLTPELHIGLKKKNWLCSWKAIKELVGAGIWNSVSGVGNILLNSMDLLISNLFISPTAMGVLSLAKMLPHNLEKFSTSICRAFLPEIMINLASENKEKMLRDLTRACKLTGVILIVPLAGIIVLGEDFFRLWIPGEDARLLGTIAVITCMGYAFTSGTQVLTGIFPAANKVKPNTISLVISGIVSTVLVFVLLKTTDLGIYAVAGTSVVVSLIRNLVFVIPYSAKYLGFKKTQFYPQVLRCFVSTCLISLIGMGIRSVFPVSGWLSFAACAVVIGCVGLTINILLFLDRDEKRMLKAKLLRRR